MFFNHIIDFYEEQYINKKNNGCLVDNILKWCILRFSYNDKNFKSS